ncbi:MAG: ribonuclease P protein component [Formivibrio sp.]|nr:ribonuclease P protein component [Formivibrio sp.]
MRLLKTDDFSSVFSLRRSIGDAFFQLLVAPNGLPYARLGLVVGRKADKRAVARNYIKRLTRETFRQNATCLAGLDVVIRARRTFDRKESVAARAALLGLFDRAQKWRV